MRIFDYRPTGGRDFNATMQCEHCGHKQDISSGYEDQHYHAKVIPAMTCCGCGKNRAGFVPVQKNDSGMGHVPA